VCNSFQLCATHSNCVQLIPIVKNSFQLCTTYSDHVTRVPLSLCVSESALWAAGSNFSRADRSPLQKGLNFLPLLESGPQAGALETRPHLLLLPGAAGVPEYPFDLIRFFLSSSPTLNPSYSLRLLSSTLLTRCFLYSAPFPLQDPYLLTTLPFPSRLLSYSSTVLLGSSLTH
jgi:hypothetical protein